MALTGIQIFKLTPKTNCKECGFPTCMAFSMKVAAGSEPIEKCPYISDDAKAELAEATAPPMKTVTVGTGDYEAKLGGETVLFRHEKTFVNKSLIAVQFSEDLADDVIDGKIANVKDVDFERIGEQMYAEVLVAKYAGDKDKYIALINKLKDLNKIIALVCEDVDVAKETVALVKDTRPILVGGTKDNIDAMVALAKENNVVLGLCGDTVEDIYGLVEAAHKADFKNDLIINTTGNDAAKTFETTVEVRRTAIEGKDRVLGYPSIVFVNDLAKGNPYLETALTSTFILKYGSIIVLDDIAIAQGLPIFGLRQNVFTDPQKPMRVEPKVYEYNKPTEDSPVLLTVDFALTYFIVSGDIERSKKPAWLLVPDAGGYSVLTAWAAGKFGGSLIGKTAKESGLDEKLTKKRLIIPGDVAVIKGDIEEELPGWEIIVGPEDSMQIPKFLNELD